jgi:hypothetical protein
VSNRDVRLGGRRELESARGWSTATATSGASSVSRPVRLECGLASTAVHLLCAECSRVSYQAERGWMATVVGQDDDIAEDPEVIVHCPVALNVKDG